MEPADAPAVSNEMKTPQIHEDNRAKEELFIPMDPSPSTPETLPVVVDSPVAAASLVQLEFSQRTRASPTYLQDFFVT